MSHAPVIEGGGDRDTNINSSAAASMTEFREVKSKADDLRVELEVKSQLDKDVSHSTPVIEVGRKRNMSINNSAAASMTELREVKSTTEDLRVELEVKNQLDKDRTGTNSEVGGGEKELKDKRIRVRMDKVAKSA